MTSAKLRASTRRGSTGKGVAIGLGVGCLVLMLMCGGVLATLGYFGVRAVEEIAEAVENASSDEPEVVRQTTNEITEITIPAEFEPEYSFKMELPASLPTTGSADTTITPRFVVYEHEKGDGVLMLANIEDLDITAADMMDYARDSLFDPDDWEEVQIQEEESRELMVRGKPAVFEFARGSGRREDKEFWRIFGTFEGREGPSALLIFIEADDYDEAVITEMIDSIQ